MCVYIFIYVYIPDTPREPSGHVRISYRPTGGSMLRRLIITVLVTCLNNIFSKAINKFPNRYLILTQELKA